MLPLLLLALLFPGVALGQSALATAANALRPGQWSELSSVTGLNGGGTNILTLNSGHIFEFGHKAAWDDAGKALYYYGVSHHGNIQGRFIKYDEAANAFSIIATTNNIACCGSSGAVDPNVTPITPHSYDHHAFARGVYFHRAYNSATTRVWDRATQTWQAAATMPSFSGIFGGAFESVGTLEFFPDWGANGSLLYYDGGVGLGRFSFSGPSGFGGSWSKIVGGASGGGGQLAPSGYSNISAYSPKKKVVVFGGGTPSTGNQVQNFFKLTDAGAVTQVADLPCGNMSTTDLAANRGSLIPDPITGHFILLCSQSTQYLYNVDTNSYSALAMNLPFTLNPSSPCGGSPCYNIAFQPLHAYGVVMFIVWNGPGANAQVWLYKPNTDWHVRCNLSIRCFNFDTTADFTTCIGGGNGCYGGNFGIIPPNGTTDYTKAVRDTAVAASGDSSLRFTIPSNSGGDMAGSWHTNFSADLLTQFGASQFFAVQWRQLLSPCYAYNGVDDADCLANGTLRSYLNGGGWKQAIIGTGDKPGCSTSTSSSPNCASSCTDLELVPQNTFHRGYTQMYQSCPGPNTVNFEQSIGGGDYKMQNARPTPFCLVSQSGLAAFPPTGNCFKLVPNVWTAFQLEVTIGPRSGNFWLGSNVKLKASTNGAPWELLQDWTFGTTSAQQHYAGSPSADQKYGKLWLTPYNSGKSSAQAHPTAFTWYDEVLISTVSLPPPGAVSSGAQAFSQAVAEAGVFGEGHGGAIVRGRLGRILQRKLF